MTVERIVRIVAGTFIMLSLVLGMESFGSTPNPMFVSEYALFFTAFVGLNLFQSGFTTLCPLDTILKKMGVKSSGGCDGGCS